MICWLNPAPPPSHSVVTSVYFIKLNLKFQNRIVLLTRAILGIFILSKADLKCKKKKKGEYKNFKSDPV